MIVFGIIGLSFILSAIGQAPGGGNLDELIQQLFPEPSTITPIVPLPPRPQVNLCPEGECVINYQCANGTFVTDGSGIFDIRIRPEEELHTSPCKDIFEVCCREKSTIITPPPVIQKEGCGYRNADGLGFRIVGGNDNEAQYAEFPWMLAVLKKDPTTQELLYQCGGSLIHPSVVLTGAHCLNNKTPQEIIVRAGEWDTQTINEVYPHQDRQVSEFVVHQQFHRGALFNDIALLFLETPIEITENVNTICLPPQNHGFDGNRCFASGWGKDMFGSKGRYSVVLKKIDLPIVQRDRCLNLLRTSRLGQKFELDQSFICAGGEIGKDTCKGDGGSPLVCPIPGTVNRYYQSGIVAYGIGCATEMPAVYVNVALFRNWIDQQMGFKRLSTNTYTV